MRRLASIFALAYSSLWLSAGVALAEGAHVVVLHPVEGAADTRERSHTEQALEAAFGKAGYEVRWRTVVPGANRDSANLRSKERLGAIAKSYGAELVGFATYEASSPGALADRVLIVELAPSAGQPLHTGRLRLTPPERQQPLFAKRVDIAVATLIERSTGKAPSVGGAALPSAKSAPGAALPSASAPPAGSAAAEESAEPVTDGPSNPERERALADQLNSAPSPQLSSPQPSHNAGTNPPLAAPPASGDTSVPSGGNQPAPAAAPAPAGPEPSSLMSDAENEPHRFSAMLGFRLGSSVLYDTSSNSDLEGQWTLSTQLIGTAELPGIPGAQGRLGLGFSSGRLQGVSTTFGAAYFIAVPGVPSYSAISVGLGVDAGVLFITKDSVSDDTRVEVAGAALVRWIPRDPVVFEAALPSLRFVSGSHGNLEFGLALRGGVRF